MIMSRPHCSSVDLLVSPCFLVNKIILARLIKIVTALNCNLWLVRDFHNHRTERMKYLCHILAMSSPSSGSVLVY